MPNLTQKIKEMHTKTRRYHYAPVSMGKTWEKTSCWWVCGKMGTSDPSMAGGSVDRESFPRKDQTKCGVKWWIPCDSGEATHEDSTVTAHGSQELEVTQVPTKGARIRKVEHAPRAEGDTFVTSDKPNVQASGWRVQKDCTEREKKKRRNSKIFSFGNHNTVLGNQACTENIFQGH